MNDIAIRSARPSDARELLEIYAPYVKNTAITFEYDVPTVDEFSQRIQKTLSKYPYIVAESGGEAVGYAYAGPFKNRAAYDRSVETTVYVKQKHRKKGIGCALYAELERLLKEQNILNMYACIAYAMQEDEYLTNDSERFHKKIGFETVGRFHKCGYKFGRWYDMIWMEKLIGEHK